MSSGPESGATECLSCGATVSERYCGACGEKRVGSHDLQVGHLAHDFWHEVTHLDGKIWRSFRALLLQPGLLTQQYWEGRHGRWMRPLRIFLIVTALSLILAPEAAGPLGLRLFVTPSAARTSILIGQRPTVQSVSGGVAQGAVVLDRGLTDDEAAALRARFQRMFKIMQYLGLAAFAWFSMLLLRKVQPYYGAHLIWALHYYSFVYVLTGVVDKTHANPMVGIVAQIVYLVLAMRRLAGGAWWAAVLRSAALMGAVSVSELLVVLAALRLALLE